MNKLFLLVSISLLVFITSCKKDLVNTDPSAKLAFSTDTLAFDTVFTQMGSATHRFMIYNRNSDAIIVSNITLKSGSNSNFRLNVNGQSGTDFTDLEIKGNDSVFVFAEVTIDPNNTTNPFVIFDEVVFKTNGNSQSVVLSAWGQNAYYYKPNLFINGLPPISHVSDYPQYYPVGSVIDLPNDKPHVIFGFLMIDSAITLNIKPGTQLHFFDQAGMWAYRGSVLNVNGSLGNEVVFQGTRLEEYYDDQPGQWDRIILNEGPSDHTFNNVLIKNAFIGIQAEEFYLDGVPELASNSVKLYNTKIQNSAGLAMLVRNHNIIADNVLLANSGNILLAIQGAGKHQFLHTTIANFWRFGTRSDETVYLTNYFTLPSSNGGQLEVIGDLDVTFSNSIIYGTNDEELLTDSLPSADFKYLFQNCVIRTEKDTLDVGLQGKFKNLVLNPTGPSGDKYNNPLFVDPYTDDFLLHDSSRAIDFGNLILTDTLLNDLKGDPRGTLPDLGSYEL